MQHFITASWYVEVCLPAVISKFQEVRDTFQYSSTTGERQITHKFSNKSGRIIFDPKKNHCEGWCTNSGISRGSMGSYEYVQVDIGKYENLQEM